MAITIELNDAAQDSLRHKAAAHGIPAEDYARDLLERMLIPVDGEPFPVLEGYVPNLTKDEVYP